MIYLGRERPAIPYAQWSQNASHSVHCAKMSTSLVIAEMLMLDTGMWHFRCSKLGSNQTLAWSILCSLLLWQSICKHISIACVKMNAGEDLYLQSISLSSVKWMEDQRFEKMSHCDSLQYIHNKIYLNLVRNSRN